MFTLISEKISINNWRTSRFQKNDKLAFISFGAAPHKESNAPQEIYSLIISDLDYIEESEQCFLHLDEAIKAINDRFFDWELVDLKTKKAEGGCGDCAAH